MTKEFKKKWAEIRRKNQVVKIVKLTEDNLDIEEHHLADGRVIYKIMNWGRKI